MRGSHYWHWPVGSVPSPDKVEDAPYLTVWSLRTYTLARDV